ncbi:MAG: shikimate dehydrogenase [Candidatus Omnitrophica bacterium]|nr:shikimate dehydrogenase [Candidatus Omnitrophota bacterium]
MKKNKSFKIYGVLGYPVKHSLSPLMHNAALRRFKIEAEYKLFEKSPRELKSFLRSLPQENVHGLNVTVPHKENVIKFLDTVSSEARLIGAVNTVQIRSGKLLGFNTDGAGFIKHLTRDLKFNPKKKNVVIIGAGGAAKAVAVFLAKSGIRQLDIFDIDKNKVSQLVTHLKINFPKVNFVQAKTASELKISECDLLINATPLGMKSLDILPADVRLIRQGTLVYDLVYNPKQTKFLKIAKQKGARVSNGLGMLLYQGALSFKYFTGKNAPVEVMRRALNRGVNRL